MKDKKKILITGSTGLIGKNFNNDIRSKKYLILKPNRKKLNLENFEKIKKYLKTNKPDIIVHLAAHVGGIQYNIKNQKQMFIDNYEISKNLIKAAYECKIYKLINISSSCAYPQNKNNYKETDLLTGEFEPTNIGYAMAKAFSTKYCEFINLERRFKYITLVPCNLFGRFENIEKEKSHMLISAIRKISYAKNKNIKKVNIWGSGNNKREYMYVEDFVDFLFFVLKKFNTIPNIINVGTGKDYKIKEYYFRISKVLKHKINLIKINKPEGQKQKLMNINLLRKTGWKPKIGLNKGIQRTYEYLKKINF